MVKEAYPWPEPGDLPFADEEGLSSACLNFSRRNWRVYIKGYKHGADILAQHAEINEPVLDVLVFPIVFMYRHYLELQLKDLIQVGNELLDREGSYLAIHGLDDLWKECRLVIDEMPLSPASRDLDTLQDCIHQFAQVDPTSTAFR